MKAGLSALCRFAAPLVLGAVALASIGCDDSVGGESGEDGTGGGGDTIVPPQSIDALDLLLVVDSSGSMSDKQAFLAGSIRPFLERIRSPRCVDAAHAPIAAQPAQGAACPDGSVREFTPDVTVHIGLISSSLGSGTSTVCDPAQAGFNNDDRAHLVWRSQPGTGANDLPSYQNLGFFAWDPGAKLSPAGISDFEELNTLVQSAIAGIGEQGCGLEMPLEAMYQFLNAPEPNRRVTGDGGVTETDQVVLDQRAAFLRDDSVVQVILLSDENDASFRADNIGNFGMSAPGQVTMPRARTECASDPNDACCVSCIDATPAGCAGDGGCPEPGNTTNPGNYYPSDAVENEINLRSWDTKRRFGIDFLAPVERYIEGLQSTTLTLPSSDTAPNPLFVANPSRQVLFTAVVGVPWQLVARRNDAGAPDASLGFQSGAEMLQAGTWDLILGDPANGVLPGDPHMIETPFERAGISDGDPINGNDFETFQKDLQYACVFDLPPELHRQCDPEEGSGCKTPCDGQSTDKPICSPSDPLLQIRANAYPGVRQLQVAKALAERALVVPICGLSELASEPPPDAPGPVGTFIMSTGLGQAAEQTASALGGVSQ